jgi:hypothetical protein
MFDRVGAGGFYGDVFMAVRRPRVGKPGQQRVSEKIAHLVESGEVPNTATGRKQAAGIAYGMERSKRLGRHGVYHPKKTRGRGK